MKKPRKRLMHDPLGWIGASIDSDSKSTRQEEQSSLNQKERITSKASRQTSSAVDTGFRVHSAKVSDDSGEWTRKTYEAKKEYHDKIEALAYWERRQIKDVLNDALGAFLSGVKVKPIPEAKRKVRRSKA